MKISNNKQTAFGGLYPQGTKRFVRRVRGLEPEITAIAPSIDECNVKQGKLGMTTIYLAFRIGKNNFLSESTRGSAFTDRGLLGLIKKTSDRLNAQYVKLFHRPYMEGENVKLTLVE